MKYIEILSLFNENMSKNKSKDKRKRILSKIVRIWWLVYIVLIVLMMKLN